MDVKTYIESGILEAYALSLVTEKERQEVDSLCLIYDELAVELVGIQQIIREFAEARSIIPSSELKDEIVFGIKNLPKKINLGISQEVRKRKTIYSTKFKVAAVVFGLIAFGIGYWLLEKHLGLSDLQSEVGSAINTNDELQKALETLTDEFESNKEVIAYLKDSATMSIHMNGLPAKSPDSRVTVFWNPISGETYIHVEFLPTPAAEMEYQLWAIADGEPFNMGIISSDSHAGFQKVLDVTEATAFAITLEPTGGSEKPTMIEMYVLGEI